METKKLGFLIVGMSIVLGFVMFGYMQGLSTQGADLQCNPSAECQQLSSVIGTSHIIIGFIAFIFALGFYLLFFNKSEAEIIERYKQEAEKQQAKGEGGDAFETLLRPLDENEQRVLRAIREQEGITQSTLRYRTDLSKAAISQILTSFERKKLIERKAKGKTYAVFLSEF